MQECDIILHITLKVHYMYKKKEWLYEQYIIKQLSANDIAKIVGKDPKTVWSWLKKFDIPTRPRGHNIDQLPKDGSVWKGRKHTEITKEKIKQARLNDGHVPYLKNGEHWLKSTSKEKHPLYKGGLTPERQSFYSSEEWSNAVKSVWHRDNATCQRCGKHHNIEKNRGNFHIHHIISFMVKELRSDINNLVLLCKECHRWVHSKENINQEFIKVTK